MSCSSPQRHGPADAGQHAAHPAPPADVPLPARATRSSATCRRSGGWDAVNEALQSPPPSTEQILHPEKYTAHEAPIEVELADPTADLGRRRLEADVHGYVRRAQHADVGRRRRAAGRRPFRACRSASGRTPTTSPAGAAIGVAMWERDESGSWAIAWQTAWDTSADADEFDARATRASANARRHVERRSNRRHGSRPADGERAADASTSSSAALTE